METIESLRAEIARLKSSWHVETLVRKDAVIAKQEAENDRLKAELKSQQSPAVLVVVLPREESPEMTSHDSGYNLGLSECKMALTQAGIAYRVEV